MFMSTIVFLAIIGVVGVIIVLATLVAVIVILRRPDSKQGPSTAKPREEAAATRPGESTPPPATSMPEDSATLEDADTWLAEQSAALDDFDLTDLSNTFKGITQDNARRGVITHLQAPETGLIAFTSQIFNPTSAAIKAETKYGSMEIIVTQGKAGVRWNSDPIGVLDYSNLRILGPDGQLLGSMERPTEANGEYYPVGFFGNTVAEVVTNIGASSTLRWFDSQEGESQPAFQNTAEEVEDVQVLLLLGALLLEFGFFSMQTA